MANLLYVTEYVDIVQTVRGGTAIPKDPPVIPTYTVPITGTGTSQSPAFQQTTRFVRIHADSICSVRNNYPNPTAVASDDRFAANQTEFRGVDGGNKLAVISNT